MKDFFEELEKLKRKTELNKSIKESFRSSFIDFIFAGSDARGAEILRRNVQKPSILHFFQYKFMPIFLIIALVFGAGGSVSLAAENSIPGDVLYPVKVNFNEKVVAVFSVSADAKMQWETRLVERRLEEVSLLATSGKIDAEAEEKIRARFDGHAEKIKEKIAEMEERGKVRNASEAASRFEVVLKVHDEILARLQSTSSAAIVSEIGKLKIRIRYELDDVRENRSRLESRIEKEDGAPETKTAAEGKIGATENAVVSVKANIEKNRIELDIDTVARAEAQLQIAADLILVAKSKLSAGVYGEAFTTAQKSLRIVQETRGLVENGTVVKSLKKENDENDKDEAEENNGDKTEEKVRNNSMTPAEAGAEADTEVGISDLGDRDKVRSKGKK